MIFWDVNGSVSEGELHWENCAGHKFLSLNNKWISYASIFAFIGMDRNHLRSLTLISASELKYLILIISRCTYQFMGKHYPNVQVKCVIKLHLICYAMDNLHTLFLLN